MRCCLCCLVLLFSSAGFAAEDPWQMFGIRPGMTAGELRDEYGIRKFKKTDDFDPGCYTVTATKKFVPPYVGICFSPNKKPKRDKDAVVTKVFTEDPKTYADCVEAAETVMTVMRTRWGDPVSLDPVSSSRSAYLGRARRDTFIWKWLSPDSRAIGTLAIESLTSPEVVISDKCRVTIGILGAEGEMKTLEHKERSLFGD